MSSQLFATLAVVVAAVAAQTAPLLVNTPPSVTDCLPAQLTWSGGVPPYYVSLIPAGSPSSPPLQTFGQQNGNMLTWAVNQPVDSQVSVEIRDSTGALNYSDRIRIMAGPCSSNSSSSAAGGNSSSATPGKSGDASATSPKQGSGNSSPPSSSPTTTTTGGSTSPVSSPSGSPASVAAPSSDASRNIPGLFALGFAATLVAFA